MKKLSRIKKTNLIIEWLASSSRDCNGDEMTLNYEELPFDEHEAKAMTLGLSKMFPSILPSAASLNWEYSLVFIPKIFNPDADRILTIKKLLKPKKI